MSENENTSGQAAVSRILIVEDEAIIAFDLQRHLEGLGYDIGAIVNTAENALILLENDRPDLIVMDIVLKGKMDGIEAAEVIRGKWGIPVVFMTAYADTDRLVRAKLTYPFGYLLKPFNKRDLKITVEMALHVGKVDKARREAENGLKKTKDQLQQILDTVPAMVWQKDIEGRYLMVNGHYCDAVGLSRENIIGRTDHDIYSKEIAEQYTRYDRQVIRTGTPESGIEEHFVKQSGEFGWSLANKLPYRDNDDNIAGTIGFALDITELKKSEEALRETEARLSSISDNLPNGLVYQIDSGQDGQQRVFSYISAGVEQLHGIHASEALNNSMTIYGQVIEEDRQLVAEREALALAKMSPFSVEARVRLASGETRWRLFNSAPRRLANNHLVWDGIEIDITSRKEFEEKLQASEEKYRILVENLDLGVFITTLEGTFLYANPAVARMTGYETVEEVMATPAHCFHAEAQNRDRFVNGLLERGRVRDFETLGRKKDGTLRWVSLNSVLMKDDTGKPASILNVSEDITDRKFAESEREHLISELQALNREVHHRVKNNFSVLISLLNIQIRKERDLAIINSIREIQGRLRTMAMINEELYCGKSLAKIDLDDFLRRLCKTIFRLSSLSDQGVSLDFEGSTGFTIDPDQAIPCGLILNELLTNLTKYAFPGDRTGEVVVSVKSLDQGRMELRVRDNGVGLPSDINGLMTNSFGLSLVKLLVEGQLKGSIEVLDGPGTQFRIVF